MSMATTTTFKNIWDMSSSMQIVGALSFVCLFVDLFIHSFFCLLFVCMLIVLNDCSYS